MDIQELQRLQELHQRATKLAQDATSLSGSDKKCVLKHALELERDAANMLTAIEDHEPARSILYRSAAALAYSVGEYNEASRLAMLGLHGYPDDKETVLLNNVWANSTLEATRSSN